MLKQIISRNFLPYYLLLASILMIAQALFFEISVANNFNIYIYIENNFRTPAIAYNIIGVFFWVGFMNVFINAGGATYLLLNKRHFFISIISLFAVILFTYYALMTMKEF